MNGRCKEAILNSIPSKGNDQQPQEHETETDEAQGSILHFREFPGQCLDFGGEAEIGDPFKDHHQAQGG